MSWYIPDQFSRFIIFIYYSAISLPPPSPRFAAASTWFAPTPPAVASLSTSPHLIHLPPASALPECSPSSPRTRSSASRSGTSGFSCSIFAPTLTHSSFFSSCSRCFIALICYCSCFSSLSAYCLASVCSSSYRLISSSPASASFTAAPLPSSLLCPVDGLFRST